MPFEYEVPSAAAGDEGVEGFSVEVGGARVGRAAALNRAPGGLILIVDTGRAYRALPARLVAEIDVAGEVVRLTTEGEAAFAAAPEIAPRERRAEGPHLVRHIPPELARLLTEGGARRSRSRLWLVVAGLVVLAGFAVLPVNLLIEHEVGGGLRWGWLAVPLVLLGGAAWSASVAVDRESPRPISLREKLADAPALVFGISPRTRRRG